MKYKEQSRIKKALMNTSFELLYELIAAICGFILPRLIMLNFGSAYNGITQSISQFIGCISLLRSGIGGVSKAALYAPLSQNNYIGVSEVVNSTKRFMRKIALIFLFGTFVFAALYPFIISDDFGWLFAASLVLILSISTFSQYYFGFANQMVLQADQKNYLISLANILSTIVNTVLASILIIHGSSIHIVKLVSAISFAVPPVFYSIYVTKKYRIDSKVPPNNNVIKQRWDAFGHQLANFVNNNTDIMVITIFLGVKEVSVYTTYYMIANYLKKITQSISTGTTAAFGNMIAKKETINLKNRFQQYELLVFMFGSFLFTVTAITITPFVLVYTKGVNDVQYKRLIFGLLVSIAEFLVCIKLPYEQLVFASGRFKETKKDAIVEAIINICLSLIAVQFIGINGIMVGTIIAALYRVIKYEKFVSNMIISRSHTRFWMCLLSFLLIFTTSYLLFFILRFDLGDSYLSWLLLALIVSIAVLFFCALISFVLFKKDSKELIRILLSKVIKRSKKS